MANIVPLPAVFLPSVGQSTVPFDMWMEMFTNYLLAIHTEGDNWPNKRKRALLLHCLGAEGQHISYTLTNGGTTYDEAVTALNAHFRPAINVVVERHKFRQRVQRPHETVAEYVGALREFGGNSEEMIRDQLIEHSSCPRICEKLLVQTEGNLTLDVAVKMACQVEAAIGHVQTLAGEPQAQVQVVKAKPKRQFKHKTKSYNLTDATATPK